MARSAINLEKNKYDRQIRLWKTHGQLSLEKSRVCLLEGTAIGAEILKNLILPGIGSYLIVDNSFVTETDVKTSFFLNIDSLNKAKAPQMCKLLQQLNNDVKGEYLISTLESILEHNPTFFKQFDIVITSIFDETFLLKLEKNLWELNIPLIIVYSIGFIGYLRIAIPEHTIEETHQEGIEDLRIDCPWPELKALASKFQLKNIKSDHYPQLPYVLVLLNCIDIWKLENRETLPYTYKEKEQFKEIIRSYMKGFDEKSIKEVLSVAWKASYVTSIPEDIQSILKDDKCLYLSSESSEFWILCRAISNYISTEGNGLLPLSGTLPDMRSDSEIYIQLKNIYYQKAQKDYECVRRCVQNILMSINQPISKISDKKIKLFCKQSRYIKVLRYRSLEQEYKYPNLDLIKSSFSVPDTLIIWYIALRTYNKYRNIFGKYAGSEETALDDDTKKYIQLTKNFLSELDCNITDLQMMACKELIRTGGEVLNNTISFIGGIAAQEAIKELSLNNTSQLTILTYLMEFQVEVRPGSSSLKSFVGIIFLKNI
ncbi:hypothetical protein PORY_000953 [Pneumocystis oryctolagi]|uniref:Uncharacterized protein n=1 Tax=Pneumocystis oryctolagi TaxID=42067 RepID=A0ACB7CFU5_9ASCO|nr:hypothetical protein PORY_000953 [Pneumocystis oryctolagi]